MEGRVCEVWTGVMLVGERLTPVGTSDPPIMLRSQITPESGSLAWSGERTATPPHELESARYGLS